MPKSDFRSSEPTVCLTLPYSDHLLIYELKIQFYTDQINKYQSTSTLERSDKNSIRTRNAVFRYIEVN